MPRSPAAMPSIAASQPDGHLVEAPATQVGTLGAHGRGAPPRYIRQKILLSVRRMTPLPGSVKTVGLVSVAYFVFAQMPGG